MSHPDHKSKRYETREEWLQRATRFLRPVFSAAGFPVPERVRVSCGWPSSGGKGTKVRTLGECWQPVASADQTPEIFVSPTIGDGVEALGVLVHELVHAATPGHGHGPRFRKAALAVGLKGKPKSCLPGDELKERLSGLIRDYLSTYPHAALTPGLQAKKQSTRMILLECKCGLKVRAARKWIDAYGGTWPCPCGEKLVADLDVEDEAGHGEGDGCTVIDTFKRQMPDAGVAA